MSDKVKNVEKTEKEIITEIIINTIKMLINRGSLKNDMNNYNKNISVNVDMEFKLKENDKQFIIKFIDIPLTTIKKVAGIEEFLNNNIEYHKIIILKDKKIIPKVYSQFIQYNNTEVFTRDNLMIDLVSHDIIPRHILLSDDEKEKVLSEYNITKKNLPQMLSSDPIARYYNMKVGDVVKIIRPSITGGHAVAYRIIIK